MAPVPDKIEIANLHQADRRQQTSQAARQRNIDPTIPVVPPKRSKIDVEIMATAFAAPDLGH
jgi:hypothetical protein